MPPDVDSTTERVINARATLASLTTDELAMRVIDDVLSEGYAQALEGDAWLMRAEQRLHALIDDATVPARGRELRTVAREHSGFQRSVIALRRELEALRQERSRLRSHSHARSS